MSELLKYQGRLAQNKLETQDKRLRIQGLVRSLRDLVDPTLPEEALNGPVISAQAFDLAKLLIDLLELQEQARIIKTALGQ